MKPLLQGSKYYDVVSPGIVAHGRDTSSSLGMLKKDSRREDLPRVLEDE